MDVPVTSSLSVRFFPVCAFVFFDLCSNGYRKTYNTEFLVSLCAPPHIFDVFNALPTGHRDVDIATSTSRRRLLPTSIHYIAMAPSHRGRGSGRGRGRGRGREGLAAAAREAEAAKLLATTANTEEQTTPAPPPLPAATRSSPRRFISTAIAATANTLAPILTIMSHTTNTSGLSSAGSRSITTARATLANDFDGADAADDADDDDDDADDDVDNGDASVGRKKTGVDSDDGANDDDDNDEDAAGDGEDIQSLLDHFAGGNDYDSIGHNHANDYASQEFDLLDRIFHWMDPVTIINERNRRAFEACILIEAGQSVDEGATTDENTLHEIMRVSYTRLLRDIPADRFESVAVRDAMLLQLKGGKEPSFSGKTLWRQQKEARKSVRTLAAEMPGATNFHSLPSGHSLRDAMKRLVCKKFIVRKGAKKVYEDVMDAWEDVPVGWWLEHHSIVFLLALMVHRQSPTITAVAAVAAPGQTRDAQRATAAESVVEVRRAESTKRHQSKQTSGDSELERTFKAARVEGMKGVAIKHRITAAELKLRMMNENRAYYVAAASDAATGEVELNRKIKSVIDNLPDTFEDLTGQGKSAEEE